MLLGNFINVVKEKGGFIYIDLHTRSITEGIKNVLVMLPFRKGTSTKKYSIVNKKKVSEVELRGKFDTRYIPCYVSM